MKLPTENLNSFAAITERVPDKQGVPYETIAQFKGVQQLDGYDEGHALMLVQSDSGSLDLRTVDFP
jgi:hypothetical protein